MSNLEALWLKVKKTFGLSEKYKKEFLLACQQHKQQHGVYPSYARLEKVPGLDSSKIKFLVEIGESKAIFYNARNLKSRKGTHNYVHPTKKQYLLTDAKGEVLIYMGNTRVKNDGWLHD